MNDSSEIPLNHNKHLGWVFCLFVLLFVSVWSFLFSWGGGRAGGGGWPCQVACRILVPPPGIEPVPPALKVYSLPLHCQGSPWAGFYALSKETEPNTLDASVAQH